MKGNIKRFLALFLAIAMVFASGAILTNDGFKAANEHHHSDACYQWDWVLSCDKEEHVHTDDCFETETVTEVEYGDEFPGGWRYVEVETKGEYPICGKEYHVHSQAAVGSDDNQLYDSCYVWDKLYLICGLEESDGDPEDTSDENGDDANGDDVQDSLGADAEETIVSYTFECIYEDVLGGESGSLGKSYTRTVSNKGGAFVEGPITTDIIEDDNYYYFVCDVSKDVNYVQDYKGRLAYEMINYKDVLIPEWGQTEPWPVPLQINVNSVDTTTDESAGKHTTIPHDMVGEIRYYRFPKDKIEVEKKYNLIFKYYESVVENGQIVSQVPISGFDFSVPINNDGTLVNGDFEVNNADGYFWYDAHSKRGDVSGEAWAETDDAGNLLIGAETNEVDDFVSPFDGSKWWPTAQTWTITGYNPKGEITGDIIVEMLHLKGANPDNNTTDEDPAEGNPGDDTSKKTIVKYVDENGTPIKSQEEKDYDDTDKAPITGADGKKYEWNKVEPTPTTDADGNTVYEVVFKEKPPVDVPYKIILKTDKGEIINTITGTGKPGDVINIKDYKGPQTVNVDGKDVKHNYTGNVKEDNFTLVEGAPNEVILTFSPEKTMPLYSVKVNYWIKGENGSYTKLQESEERIISSSGSIQGVVKDDENGTIQGGINTPEVDQMLNGEKVIVPIAKVTIDNEEVKDYKGLNKTTFVKVNKEITKDVVIDVYYDPTYVKEEAPATNNTTTGTPGENPGTTPTPTPAVPTPVTPDSNTPISLVPSSPAVPATPATPATPNTPVATETPAAPAPIAPEAPATPEAPAVPATPEAPAAEDTFVAALPATVTVQSAPAAVPLNDTTVVEVTDDGNGNLTLTQIDDVEAALANMDLGDHICNILYFILLLSTSVALYEYFRSAKKHNERIFELRAELGEDDPYKKNNK